MRPVWARCEWRYVERREGVSKAVRALTAERIREVAWKCLAERDCIVCTITPRESQERSALR